MSILKQNLLLLLASAAFSLLAAEALLRVLGSAPPPRRASFSVPDPELGWDARPGSEGEYHGEGCTGWVRFDERGIRLNGRAATHLEGHRNVFVIGDSNTAGLQVDNEETFTAILERELRRGGEVVNVLNLGVPGFDPAQSVAKALRLAPDFHPTDVVYVYTDNDVFDLSVIKNPYSPFRRQVLLARDGRNFEPFGLPDLGSDPGAYGAVVMNRDGTPRVFSGRVDLPEPPPPGPFRRWLIRNLYLYRAIDRLRAPRPEHQRIVDYWKGRAADPREVLEDERYDALDVLAALFHSLVDGGIYRTRHQAYFDAQLTHVLGRLRTIPSVRKVHLVQFVSEATQELLDGGRPSSNGQLFESLLPSGVVDSYIDLNAALRRQGLPPKSFECPDGSHYGAEGHSWMARTILDGIDLRAGTEDSVCRAAPSSGLRRDRLVSEVADVAPVAGFFEHEGDLHVDAPFGDLAVLDDHRLLVDPGASDPVEGGRGTADAGLDRVVKAVRGGRGDLGDFGDGHR